VRIETIFNAPQPFYSCMIIYLTGFFFATLSGLKWPEPARQSAWGLVARVGHRDRGYRDPHGCRAPSARDELLLLRALHRLGLAR
jgi:hypothetical protein